MQHGGRRPYQRERSVNRYQAGEQGRYPEGTRVYVGKDCSVAKEHLRMYDVDKVSWWNETWRGQGGVRLCFVGYNIV